MVVCVFVVAWNWTYSISEVPLCFEDVLSSDVKSIIIGYRFHVCTMSFFLRCFDIVSLSLVFSSFVMMFLGIIFFVLSVFGGHLPWIYKFISFIKFGEFSAIIFSSIFSASAPFSCSSWPPIIPVRPFGPQVFGVFSFKSFILYALKIDHFYSSIFMFKFTNSFVISVLSLSPSVSFLFQTFYFPVLEFFSFFKKKVVSTSLGRILIFCSFQVCFPLRYETQLWLFYTIW